MSKNLQKKYTEPWRVFAQTWKKIYPPSRPSRGNILAFEKLMLEAVKAKKDVRVLLLGATPELRDLFARYKKIAVTVCDINMEMIMAMTNLMKRKTARETWIKASWLTAPLKENYYDLVFGDYITGNVPRKNLPQLYQQINKLLKKGGYFITRFFSYFDQKAVLNLDDLILTMSRKKVSDKVISDLWTFGVFCCGSQNKQVSSDHLFARMEILGKKDKRVTKLYRAALKIIPRHKFWAYGYSGEQDLKLLNKYFVVEKYLPDTYNKIYRALSRIYKLKKK